MPKIVVTDNIKDEGISLSGGGTTITQTGLTTSRIDRTTISSKYRIEIIESTIKQDDNVAYEVAKIRVRPLGLNPQFSREVRRDFSVGEKSNYSFKMAELVDLVETHTDSPNTAKDQASYSFETIFNYIAEDYDNLQVGIEEHNLHAAFDQVSMTDFLDLDSPNSRAFNFGRGNQTKNIIMPTMKIKQGNDEAPYYNYLRLNQRLDNRISHFAVKIGIFDDLLQSYINGEYISQSFDIQQGRAVAPATEKQMYDLESFFTTDAELDLDNFYTLGRSITPSRMSLGLRKHLMRGLLKNVSKTGFRTYKELLQNKQAHKEVFCYSIDKYDEVILDSTKIQSIYAPALEESTPIVDTQVKYGKGYSYRIAGHYMVVGNSYSYSYKQEESMTDPDDPYATFEVRNRASVVLMPMELFTKRINVVQKPPVAPQVKFKTKNDSGKKISIYLSPTKTDAKAPFVSILREDLDQLTSLQQLPRAIDENGNVHFKTYGDQGLFEIFRLESPPMSYSDFRDSKIAEISMPFQTTDAIFHDNVVANKKYYYTFRSVNQKDMVSNPTTVFETTLLVDADDSKVVVETYHFPKLRDMERELGFRKLVRITPAIEHILFDETQDALFEKESLVGTLDNLNLGILDKAVWGRKFKIRIKSKTSGKMIDIILNVDLTKNKTEEEF